MHGPWLLHLYVCAGEVLLGALVATGIAARREDTFYYYGDLRPVLYALIALVGVVHVGLSSLLLLGLCALEPPTQAVLLAHGLAPLGNALLLVLLVRRLMGG